MKNEKGYEPGPYADEKPTITITSANFHEHQDKLTETQKRLFERYPQHYKMLVYPSHRDFGFPGWTNDWWRINTPMTPSLFTPESIARGGR